MLLQWKLSNHDVSPSYITSFGFCCVHKNWSNQTRVWSNGIRLVSRCKANYMPIEVRISVPMHALTLDSEFFSTMIARLVPKLLKSRDNITVLHQFINFDTFPLQHSRIFLNVWKQFFSGGLTLPATQFASINHINTLRILHFTPRAKDFY